MTIQAISAVNAKSNIDNNFKRSTNNNDVPKANNTNFNDDRRKICIALSGLAVLSLAGIGIAAALRKGKAVPSKDSASTIKGIQNTVDFSQVSAKTMITPETISTVQKDVSKPVQQINGQFIQSTSYSPVRRNPVSGRNENIRPDVTMKQTEAEIRANMLKKNAIAQQILKDSNKNIITSVGEIKNAGQGIKNATSVQLLDGKAKEAQNAAQNIANRAQEIKNIAEEIPTHKNIKRAQTAQNKAIRAKLDADKVQEKVDKKKEQIILDTLRKEQNIQKTINNTTPERLLEGQRKMEENAQKTSARVIQRRAKQAVNRPGYQRALRQFQNYSPEKLETVINSTKSSNIEKIVAQDLLSAGKV